jgi:hypothetical protein
MRVDHEPDQTTENMQRGEKMWRNKRMFKGTRDQLIGKCFDVMLGERC